MGFAASASGPENNRRIIDGLINAIYPEEKIKKMNFFNRSSEMMSKLKNMDLKVLPLDRLPTNYKKNKK